MFKNIQAESPEAAEQIAKLQEKMGKLFREDLLKRFSDGTISLRNIRKQLQNLGMEDAETKAVLYDQALKLLFNDTMPLGEIQLERLWEDIKKLKDEMVEAQNETEG